MAVNTETGSYLAFHQPFAWTQTAKQNVLLQRLRDLILGSFCDSGRKQLRRHQSGSPCGHHGASRRRMVSHSSKSSSSKKLTILSTICLSCLQRAGEPF